MIAQHFFRNFHFRFTKSRFSRIQQKKFKNMLFLKLPGQIFPSSVKFILHSEIKPRRRSEIRRFFAVLENIIPKLKNGLPLNHKQFHFLGSCEVWPESYASSRRRSIWNLIRRSRTLRMVATTIDQKEFWEIIFVNWK
jgi:hypothetical protein